MPRDTKKLPLYHFGIPLDRGQVKFGQTTSFGANVGNVCPMSKLRDLLAPSSTMDSETLKNLLPSFFQGQIVNKNTRRQANKSSCKMKHRVCIDVAKLDEITSLSSGEKGRIKNILSLIRCDSEVQTTVKTKANPKKKKVISHKKATRSYAKENLAAAATSLKDVNKFKAHISKASGRQRCPDCEATSQARVPKSTLSKNSHKVKLQGLNASSQEKLLQALINLDPDYVNRRASQLEGVRRPNQINISKFKVKYVNPTYVVQYNGDDKPPQLTRERFYSNVALESHLGHRPVLTVRDEKKDRQSMHYEDSMPHIVGMGLVTERMLREQSATVDEQADSEEEQADSEEEQANSPEKSARSERAPWQRDSVPGYLKPPLPDSSSQPKSSPATADPPAPRTSVCQRLLSCVRRVLRMSGQENSQELGEKTPKRKATVSDDVEVEPPFVRTTKSQFFRRGPKT